jgi:hypothetical protein
VLTHEPPTLGLGLITQVEPFQCSTSVRETPYCVKPTAKQFVALVHDTPESSTVKPGRVVPGGFGLGLGLGTMVQVVPSQRSLNVRVILPIA